jgi:hypothetical protein
MPVFYIKYPKSLEAKGKYYIYKTIYKFLYVHPYLEARKRTKLNPIIHGHPERDGQYRKLILTNFVWFQTFRTLVYTWPVNRFYLL